VKESFDKVNYWLSQLKKFAPKDIVILIVGNKIDKENERKISKDQLIKFCDQQNVMYEEASAKEDLGVSQLFRNIAGGMLNSLEIMKVVGSKSNDDGQGQKKKLMDLGGTSLSRGQSVKAKDKKKCC
jgi:GTPase SAR1 family protein